MLILFRAVFELARRLRTEAVVGVSAKAVTASGQFFVEVVKHEIAEDGLTRAALRRALIQRTEQTVFHHPGIEKRPDEFVHTLIGHAYGDPSPDLGRRSPISHATRIGSLSRTADSFGSTTRASLSVGRTTGSKGAAVLRP